MACFIVPGTVALVTTVASKVAPKKEVEAQPLKVEISDGVVEEATKIPFRRKLAWLTNLMWGGAVLLAFEHVWHGEVTPWFPFLTAASNPGDTAEMLHEMSTIGVGMAVLITAVWGVMLIASRAIEKRAIISSQAA
jgi:hypothetical protein